jgi:subtilase family serine protease
MKINHGRQTVNIRDVRLRNKRSSETAKLSFGGGLFASAILLLLCMVPATAAGRQTLHGCVPDAVARFNLQPTGRLPATNMVLLAINLPLRNKSALTNLLQQIYDPASTNFHRFLNPQQFTERFGPTEQDYQTVLNFTKTNGFQVVRTYTNRAFLEVRASVSDIERTFQVTLHRYRHPTEDRDFYAPDVEPSQDSGVPNLGVLGLDNYARSHPMLHLKPAGINDGTPAGSGPRSTLIGNDFRNAYVSGTQLNGSGQMVGLVEFDGYYQSDITAYENLAGLPNVPLQNVLVIDLYDNPFGGAPSGNLNTESEVALDIEMVISMAPGLSQLVVYEAGDASDNVSWGAMLAQMIENNQIKQFSCSWSRSSNPFNDNSDNAFAEMQLQGQSFFVASGDGDAYTVTPPWPCYDSQLTLVGGTSLTLNSNGTAYASEVVWNAGLQSPAWGFNGAVSGGGYWGSGGGGIAGSTPAWQQGLGISGRSIPDVAAAATGIYVAYHNGTNGTFEGTSCAAPLWAGFTALVNQQAANYGLPSVGFLNPAIYLIGQGPLYSSCFHDITNGNDEWPGSPSQFAAGPGYDQCTGWGTPNRINLINALLPFSGQAWVDFSTQLPGSFQLGIFDFPYKTLAQGTNGVSQFGTIILKTPTSSSETMTITKPLSIRAYSGPATIGN